MPNHLHLILPKTNFHHTQKNTSQQKLLYQLGGLRGAMSQRQKIPHLWQPIPPPTEIPDATHLRRHVRYVALNPCRKRLCTDPLEWYWSTYREILGATVERSKSVLPLVQMLRESMHHDMENAQNIQNFRIRFHAYVSGDPSVSVQGTKFPLPAIPKKWAEQSVSEILWAASAALRVPTTDAQKKGPLRALFIHLAARHGWRQPLSLARICQITPSAVHKILNHTPPDMTTMGAAELCLGDQRLRFHPRAHENRAALPKSCP